LGLAQERIASLTIDAFHMRRVLSRSSQINCHAFSGGKETREEQEKYGADISVDISVMYLEFFLEDDAELADIKEVG